VESKVLNNGYGAKGSTNKQQMMVWETGFIADFPNVAFYARPIE
jgi:hypothetical protein